MSLRSLCFALSAFALTAPAAAQDQPSAGIWTNTEDEYFAEEEGRERPAWIALEIDAEGQWRTIDAFGAAQSEWTAGPIPGIARRGENGWQIDGSELRLARAFSCWVSVRKFAGKADGSEDWTFVRGLETFDQGGRILVPGEGLAPDVTIRLRNVTWAAGSRNKPALAIYAHKDDPVRAESYSWTSPNATLIGINLRWVQASCSPQEEQ